ncbi:MAG: YihY/virulence factor BrkB family protein [Balneolaceae bacterium]
MKRILHFFKETGYLLKDSFNNWASRDPFRNSTVISYYTIFSLPGLGVIIINLAGYFFGTEAMTNEVSSQIEGMIGQEAAITVERIIANAHESQGLTLSSLASIGVLIFGATGVFYQVQQTLNIMWNVEAKPERQYIKFLMDRLFSFGMVLTIGFLLIVSLIISSLINALSQWLTVKFFGVIDLVLRVMDITLSLGIITLLFSAIYKILPDVKIRWKDVWIGAFVTALLFVIAKYLLGLYFAFSNPGSVYGAAGSIILIMLWTTYSALIMLFGAEFTRVYAKRHGVKIEPASHAEYIRSPKKKKPIQVEPESNEYEAKEGRFKEKPG